MKPAPDHRRSTVGRRPQGRALAMLLLLGSLCRASDEIADKRADKAVADGLDWLAAKQESSGGWDNPTKEVWNAPAAATALAGLAFLAHGDTPAEGKFAPRVRAAQLYLLRSAGTDGLIGGYDTAPMYGHCLAVLFLAELHGMEVNAWDAQRTEVVLRRAVEVIARAQYPNGGWGYDPVPRGDIDSAEISDEGSVTVTAVQALRAAKNAAIPVDPRVIDRAVNYIVGCQERDGGIRYTFGKSKVKGSRPSISAAAVATLFAAGVYEKPDFELSPQERKGVAAMRRTREYCLRTFGENVAPPVSAEFQMYTQLYLAQAMWTIGGSHWRQYRPRVRDWLLDSPAAGRQGDGSWSPKEEFAGRVFSTATAVLILQVSKQYLPILQR